DGDPRAPRRTAAHALHVIKRLLGVLPCAVLLVALVSPGTPLLARLLIVVLFTLTLWDPALGLLAAAGLAPLGAFIIAVAGIAVVGAAVDLFRRRPSLARSLPAALAISTSVAAATSVLLWFGIGPARILAREAVIGYRFSAHVVDLNAAGSHFAMVLCLALGMAMRERGRRRGLWMAAAAACAVGLWMSRSRSAEAAAGLVIPLAFLWAVTQTWTRARQLTLVGVVLGALVAFGAVRAWQIER